MGPDASLEEVIALLDDRYELQGELGRGGFGSVFKARQRSTGQVVAIKRLSLPEVDYPGFAEEQEQRFLRETALLAKLRSAYVVGLLDAGYDEGPWMALEFIEGKELSTVLNEDDLSIEDAVRLISQVLEALAEAHSHGIVHRDLKPQNIMITGSGIRRNAKVFDFGIAGVQEALRDTAYDSITQGDVALGTPAYMGLEQFRDFIEPRPESDVYAIGIVLLEALIVEPIFPDPNPIVIYDAKKKPIPMDEPLARTRLGQIIRKATAVAPEDRYPTAKEMLEAIDQLMEDPDALVEVKAALESRRAPQARPLPEPSLDMSAFDTVQPGQLDVELTPLPDALQQQSISFLVEEGRQKARATRNQRLIILIVFLVLLGLGGAAAYFYMAPLYATDAPPPPASEQPAEATKPAEPELEPIKIERGSTPRREAP